jgi:hypothetical protein
MNVSTRDDERPSLFPCVRTIYPAPLWRGREVMESWA